MRKLAAFYFSGTGNTRYVTERLCRRLSDKFAAEIFDVALGGDLRSAMTRAEVLLFAFPVYGSAPPVPMRRFVRDYADAIKGKEVIVVATQFMFSGDGAASLGRTVEKLGGKVTYAEHVDMPNNLSDFKFLKVRNGGDLAKKLRKADGRVDAFACNILEGYRFRRGFDPLSRAVGYFLQRKWWLKGENAKKTALRIDSEKCVGCGVCARGCPANNIGIVGGRAVPRGACVFCYRCVNTCPKKAVALFGKDCPSTQYKGPIILSDLKKESGKSAGEALKL